MQGNKTFSVRAMTLSENFTPRAILGVKKRLEGPVSKQFTRATRLCMVTIPMRTMKRPVLSPAMLKYTISAA